MKRKRGLVQVLGAKPKDNDQSVTGIASATPLLSATAPECGPIVGGAMQEPVEGTRMQPAIQQEDEAAQAAEHARRSAGSRKASITIRTNKTAAENATEAMALVTPKESKASVATGAIHLKEQIPAEFSAQSSNIAGKLFHERVGKAGITTAETERIPYPTVVSECKAKSKRKPPGVKAKENGTRLKRGAAVQVMTYPRQRRKQCS